MVFGACTPAKLTAIAATLLAAASTASAQVAPPARAPAAARSESQLEAATLFERVRAAYLAAPCTERLRISVRRPDGVIRRSLLLVRTEPNNDRDSIGRIIIRAGRLLIEASAGEDGFVRAATDPAAGAVFEGSDVTGDLPALLAAAFPPIPLAVLDVASGKAGAPDSLTPYAQHVTWDQPAPDSRPGVVVINGRIGGVGERGGGTVELSVDSSNWRIRRVSIVFDPAAGAPLGTTITIDHAASVAQLSGIRMDRADRPRVANPAELLAGSPSSAVGTLLRPGGPASAEEKLKSAMRGPDGTARAAVVLLVSPAADADAGGKRTAAVKLLNALSRELSSQAGGDVISAALVAFGDASETDDSWQQLLADQHGPASVTVIVTDGCAAELRRVAPGSMAAFAVIAPDGEILAVHPMEHLSPDPEQQVAELLMSLLDAAQARGPMPGEDPR